MNGALSGVRVLDFSRVLAGPFCTMMLGDLGADVIKVESPGEGDDTRQWGPPWHGDQSAYYLSANRNKRSLTLNLKTPEGQNIARRLAARSHVLVENFKVGQMDGFGLGYDDLKSANPSLVYCSITGFGQYGPYADRPGYDFIVEGMSGLMSITGPIDGEPYKVGVAVSDVFTGLFALSAILAALRHAERTGEGQYIDLALLDSQIAALVNVASNTLVSGQTARRFGNGSANLVPYEVFHASDGDFTLGVGNDRQFAALCVLIGQPELARDPRFTTNPARVEHRADLIPLLRPAFKHKTAGEWVDILLAAGIPAGPINDVATILNDPHVQARGLIQNITASDGEPVKLVGSPAQFSATPAEIRLPPPSLGQHTDTILREELGLDEATITRYREKGII